MSHEIESILDSNKTLFKLDRCNDIRFNHCTVLIYYAGLGLKDKSSLGYHTDCVYSPVSGEYVSNKNTQLENTPAVIYSVGDERELHWKVRKTALSKSGRNVWVMLQNDKMSFKLGPDTLTVIHPDDENPLSPKNCFDMRQYMHGGVNVSGEKFSVGFVFRVVNKICTYNKKDDTMVVPNKENAVFNGIVGFDISVFHNNLLRIYKNAIE